MAGSRILVQMTLRGHHHPVGRWAARAFYFVRVQQMPITGGIIMTAEFLQYPQQEPGSYEKPEVIILSLLQQEVCIILILPLIILQVQPGSPAGAPFSQVVQITQE